MKYIGLTKLQTQQGTRYQVQCYSQAGSDRKSHYVGTYAGEQEAARAYDLAALVLKRGTPVLNFPRETYTDTDIQAMEEWLSRPRIQSSQFKGVRRMSARAGWDSLCSLEGIQIYLGCFQTEQDAAVQYDLAQLATHKLDAAACSGKLNFDWSDVPKEQINMMSTNVRLRISRDWALTSLDSSYRSRPSTLAMSSSISNNSPRGVHDKLNSKHNSRVRRQHLRTLCFKLSSKLGSKCNRHVWQ